MKRITSLFVLFLLLGVGQGVWAGPREEVIQVIRQRGKAYSERNLEAYMTLIADDAQYMTGISPFRYDGKKAIRGAIAGIFKAFPKGGHTAAFQPSIRVYGGTTAVSTAYLIFTLVDSKGQVRRLNTRVSTTFVRQGGKWLIVNHHTSPLPSSP